MTGKSNHDGGNGGAPASGAPKGPITDSMAKPLAKRFYKDVGIGEGAFFQIQLDGRPVRTPRKRALLLPTRALADAVAAEWAAQRDLIDPSSMPLTRFANTAIDAVSEALDDVARDIVAYAGRDLVCYRAEAPVELVRRQSAAWDPIVAWAREALGVHLTVVEGILPVDQPVLALQRIAGALEPHNAFRLTALHVLTTLTGSAMIALAHARGYLSAEDAWSAALVDEDYQISVWGPDEEAAFRRFQRKSDFEAATRMLQGLR
ncbi:MAG: ATP12 family chaperone protein [Hyphomicrobium sp.]